MHGQVKSLFKEPSEGADGGVKPMRISQTGV